MHIIKTISQVALFFLFSQFGSLTAAFFHIPLPGSIIAIALVFLLLQSGLLRLEWIETGANCLIAELMLFFVPSAVGIIQYRQLMLMNGLRFEIVILLSTLTVMICTGLLAEVIHRQRRLS